MGNTKLRIARTVAAVGLAAALAACGSATQSTYRDDPPTTVHRADDHTGAARSAPAASRIRHRSSSVAASTTAASLAVPSTAGVKRSAESYVRRFYAQIDAGDFPAAWSRLPSAVRAGSGSFDAWRAGYDTTLSNEVSGVTVDTTNPAIASVALTLRATDLDACADEVRQRFSVRWTLARQGPRWVATAISVDKVSGRTPRLTSSSCPEPDDEADPSDSGAGVTVAGADAPGFCETHACIPNYANGRGYTVMCADGQYSHSGGIQGACSYHGGVAGGSSSSRSSTSTSSSPSSGGTVQVHGYYRKDGTYVHSYTRRAPCSYC